MYEDFLKLCVEKYGTTCQMAQTQEECMELALALRHYQRKKNTIEDVVSELADVSIMLKQMIVALDVEKDVNAAIAYKLRRQALRMHDEHLISSEELCNQLKYFGYDKVRF